MEFCPECESLLYYQEEELLLEVERIIFMIIHWRGL